MNKRKLVWGFAVAGAALMVSSAAFACTAFKGQMVVTGGGGSTTVVGTGGGMQYCKPPADNAAAPGGGAHGTSGSSITIALSPATCGVSMKLTKNLYNVNFSNGAAYNFTINANTHKRKYGAYKTDCMSRGAGVVALTPGTLSVPDSGIASGTFTLPGGLTKNGPSDASAVCVADAHAFQGMQAPIIIT
ncbi:MAG: hypothetical protein V7605_2583 [Acidimicrobiaceae bacterium]|jgi:hypothetical protein